MATNLKDVLECCICTVSLTDPRSLPCGHTFCSKCLVNDANVRTRNGIYPCPFCRQEVNVPAGGILQIGCNVLVKNLLEILAKRQLDYPCAFCRNNPPTSVCITCEGRRLCPSCEEHHRLHTTKHNIVDLEEFRQGRHNDAVRSLLSSICKQHNKSYEFYCRECKCILCISCSVGLGPCKHKDSLCDIHVASEEAKKAILTKKKDVETQITEMTKRMGEIIQNDELSNKSVKEVRKDISDYFDALNERVQKRKDALLQRVADLQTKKQTMRDTFKGDAAQKIEALEALKQKTERMQQYGPTETLMRDQDLLQEIENMTIQDLHDVPKPFIQHFVAHRQTPDEIDEILKPMADVEFHECLMEIDTCMPGDEKVSGISSLAVSPNDDIQAVDCQNCKVKRYMYNNRGECKGVMKHDNLKNPWTCVVLQDGTMKVSGCVSKNVVTFTEYGEYVRSLDIGKRVVGMAITSTSEIAVTNITDPPSVQLYSVACDKKWEISKDDKGNNLFNEPMFAVANSKDEIIVTDRKMNTVYILNVDGTIKSQYKGNEPGHELKFPSGVCVDKEDYIYIADQSNHRVISLTPDGVFQRVVLTKEDGLDAPCAITFDNHRHLVVSCRGDKGNRHMIKVFAISA